MAVAVLAALVFTLTVPASTATTRTVRVGGAVCVAQKTRGVICHWPGKPWAVGITPTLVLAWRNQTLNFARTNR